MRHCQIIISGAALRHRPLGGLFPTPLHCLPQTGWNDDEAIDADRQPYRLNPWRAKRLAGAQGMVYQSDKARGKDSYITLYYGDRLTVVRNPKDELKVGTYHAMLKEALMQSEIPQTTGLAQGEHLSRDPHTFHETKAGERP